MNSQYCKQEVEPRFKDRYLDAVVLLAVMVVGHKCGVSVRALLQGDRDQILINR